MSAAYYRFSTAMARFLGPWFFRASATVVAAGFFAFSPRRVSEGARFYGAAFPEWSAWRRFAGVWRQYRHFTTVFLDRFLLEAGHPVDCESDGWDRLTDAARRGGVILLMSHMGHWEMAARELRRDAGDIPLVLLMGERRNEGVERRQKRGMTEAGAVVVTANESGGSPLDVMTALDALRSGGIVSLAGDRVWNADQRTVEVPFLGRAVRFPELPWRMALMTGVPVLALFALRRPDGGYRISVSEPIPVTSGTRAERPEAVRRAAASYAALLEAALREHPFQWYHFGAFAFVSSPDSPKD